MVLHTFYSSILPTLRHFQLTSSFYCGFILFAVCVNPGNDRIGYSITNLCHILPVSTTQPRITDLPIFHIELVHQQLSLMQTLMKP